MIRIIIFAFLIELFTIGFYKAQKKIDYLEINYDSLRILLENIFDKDQKIRQIIQDSLKLGLSDNNYYIKRMLNLDAENQMIVLPLIDKYGILPLSKIGNKADDAIFYVIQHSNMEIIDKYFPQFDSLAKIGETNRRHAAMMEDRLLMYKGLKQKYGTQASSSQDSGNKLVIWPIQQPNKVDSLRKVYGFKNTIEEYAKDLGAIYDPNMKLPDK